MTRRIFLGATAHMFAARARTAPQRRLLREFPYSQVRLTGGPLADMYQRIRAHVLQLDENRLLKVYRQRVGMPAPGPDMGGWYDADGFVPGHLIGQFISGLSRFHANAGDPETADKARRLVRGFAETFERDGNPYASPKASTWACYILDKHEIGLLDAANLAGVKEARTLLPRVIQSAVKSIPDHVFDRNGVKNLPYDEPYILPENLFNTYSLTGDPSFLEMAKRYLLDRGFFDPLAAGENVLAGQHGYSHVIALSSAAKAYEILGNAKHLRAISNAWDMIEQTQQFASGAWAPQEQFVQPHSGELTASVEATHDHFETPCCFYAYAKLARYLTCFTGDAKYGDGLERALFNTILGALDPDGDGNYFYYSDYHARARKKYYQRKWPCCAGTLVQSVADYPLNIYFQDAHGIFVNLYAASEVRWIANRVPVTLAQDTTYPRSERIALLVQPESPVEFSIRLRIPGWLRRPARLSLNGKALSVDTRPRTFATIRRRWRKGDTIELVLPFSLRTEPIDDRNPHTVAIMYGPVMLAAIDPPEQLTASAKALGAMDAVPGKPLEFELETSAGKLRMRPFFEVKSETYSVYCRRTA